MSVLPTKLHYGEYFFPSGTIISMLLHKHMTCERSRSVSETMLLLSDCRTHQYLMQTNNLESDVPVPVQRLPDLLTYQNNNNNNNNRLYLKRVTHLVTN